MYAQVTMDIRAKKSGKFVEALVSASGEISVGAPLYKIDTSAAGSSSKPDASAAAAKASKDVSAKEASKQTAPAPSMETAPQPTKDSSAKEIPKNTSAEELAAGKGASKAAGKPITVPVPIMGESITSGVLSSWTVKAGDSVALDHVVATVETDKVNVEVRSPSAGRITKQYHKEGEEVKVGDALFDLEPTDGAAPSQQAAAPKEAAPAKAAAPAAQQSSQTQAATAAAAAAPAPAKKEAAKPAPAPTTAAGERGETRVKMTRMRQRIAQRLKDSQNTAAMLTTFQEVDMSSIIGMRNALKDDFEKVHGVKLGFMSAFVRVRVSYGVCCAHSGCE
jgi:pyruvate/2-oxoglutarate dehydrogenase complex dihydrolipoamide acyltransferase (E2) component